MSYYINLYDESLRSRRAMPDAAALAAALVAVCVLVLGWHVWLRQDSARMQVQVHGAEAELKVERERLAAALQAAQAPQPDAALSAELARTRAAAQARQAIMGALDGGALGNTDGFSAYLRAFARQVVDGLWLTGFDIDAGGTDMAIEGRATDAALLPGYIRRLNAEAVFQGREFAALRLSTPAQAAPAQPAGAPLPAFVEFSLASATKAAQGKP